LQFSYLVQSTICLELHFIRSDMTDRSGVRDPWFRSSIVDFDLDIEPMIVALGILLCANGSRHAYRSL
jgi:hypothetical protein